MIVPLLALAVLQTPPQAYALGPFDPRIPAAIRSVPWRVDAEQSLMFAWTKDELRLAGVDEKFVEDEVRGREKAVERIAWVRDFRKHAPPPPPAEGVPPLDASLVRRIEVAVALYRSVAPTSLAVLISPRGKDNWRIVIRSYQGGDVSKGTNVLRFGKDHSFLYSRHGSLPLKGLNLLPLPKEVLPLGSIPGEAVLVPPSASAPTSLSLPQGNRLRRPRKST